MDKLASLRIFRCVAEMRSFSLAAKELGMSRAMVSKSISRLEQALGARLLARSTRAVNMTEAGERYLQSVAPLLDELVFAERQLHQSILQPQGELRVSAPFDLADSLLARVICDFRATCPQVTVSVDLSNRQVDLHHEPFDLALRIGRVEQSSLIVRKLLDVPLVACAAPAYLRQAAPIRHPRDLAQHACLVNPSVGDARRWRFLVDGRLYSVAVQPALQINDARILVQAATAGLGVVYAPAFLVAPALAEGSLQPVLREHVLAELPLSIVYADRRFQPAKVRHFIDHLVACFNEERAL